MLPYRMTLYSSHILSSNAMSNNNDGGGIVWTGFSLAVNLNPGSILQDADQNFEKCAVFLELSLGNILDRYQFEYSW